MKWFKVSLWVGSMLVLLAAGGGAVGWFMLRGTPDWYRVKVIPPEQKKINADAVEDKLVDLTNTFGSRNAAAYRASHVKRQTTTDEMTADQAEKVLNQKADEPVVIQFTDDQLNAFFEKWAEVQNRRAVFEQYVENPRIVMQKNQLILAGRVKEMDLIVSMQFAPKIDGEGNLRMDLQQVTGGILPLADAMWARQRHGVEKMLRAKLPDYQRDAAVSTDGYANGALASAAMNEMILAAMKGGATSAVVFVPGSIQRLSPTIPVKITSIKVEDHLLTLTAEPMSVDERQKLFEQVRSFDAAPPVSAADAAQ